MNPKSNGERFSQLVDGELSTDETCDVLSATLDDADAREELKEMLNLQRSLRAWRTLEPRSNLVAAAQPHRPPRRRRFLLACCVAAVAGAAVAVVGMSMFRANRKEGVVPDQSQVALPATVTREQRREIAEVFRFHQSVAGPLKWFAADDETVQLAAADSTDAGSRPVVVLLRFQSEGERQDRVVKNCVFVCRERQPMSIRLPSNAGNSRFRVYLVPHTRDGKVHVEFAVSLDGEPNKGSVAALVGRSDVALKETPLGQLVVDGSLINVRANGWVLEGGKL